MGGPLRASPGPVGGFHDRARAREIRVAHRGGLVLCRELQVLRNESAAAAGAGSRMYGAGDGLGERWNHSYILVDPGLHDRASPRLPGGPEEEYWATETLGTNTYRSPIVYGVHPPGAVENQLPQPLSHGDTITVAVYRWKCACPESLDTGFVLLGSKRFTP